MKKLLFALWVMVMLLPLSACNGEEKVTIYIPESATIYTKNASRPNLAMEYVFEEGWQDKESFAVTYREAGFPINMSGLTLAYGDKCEISGVKGTAKTTTYYDENGRVIRRVTEYEYVINDMEKQEITYTYDENGRMLTQQTQSYYTGREEPVVQTISYSYQETEQGSEGSATVGEITEIHFYDKQHRLVRVSQVSNGEVISYTEREYDERGNQISVASYLNGELISKSTTTYKAVQVSQETADRLPKFNRETKSSFLGLFG